MNYKLSALLFVTLIYSCSNKIEFFENEKDVQSTINRFENLIKNDMIRGGSISAAIVKEDKIIWSKAFGVSNIDNNTIVDTSTIYRIASISKPITAFLMMQLVQEEIISLDDPIEQYLPEVRKIKGYSDSTKITFRLLASHISGLSEEPGLKSASSGPIEEWEDKVLESIPETSFQNQPGEMWVYSNIGYAILGLALSRAANKSFIELVQEEIFTPLHMNNSFYKIPIDKMPKLSRGIEVKASLLGIVDRKTPEKEIEGRGYKVPNGGVFSTPNDMAKFMVCNMGYNNQLLSKENLQLMQSKCTYKDNEWGYGLGFFIDMDSSSTIVHHGGGLDGYRAYFAFDKDSNYGVIIMRNYSKGKNYSKDINYLQLLSIELLKEFRKI